MLILLANPNTSAGITDGMAKAACAAASPGTEIKPVTAGFGAKVIGSRMEMVIGDYASLDLVAREGAGCDAVIVAAAIDSGLRAVKQMMSCPVLGLTEAALHAACLVGGSFGLVVSSGRTGIVMREMVAGYGLSSRLAGVRSVGIDPAALYAEPEAALDRLATTALALVEHDGADAVVLIGAVMAGLPPLLQTRVPVPVLEGVACAVPLAEAMVRIAPAKATAGSFARPHGREVSGVGDALAARF
ncbi:aspartate/glutamate racemase family protein [Falsiroseomonas oryzae]|uniref:aspartate/glutamate racemase family protein n=1 Tax=Falsiroseomonas oryzae TaxID=2766473 RepID=UPI0022EA14C5|nr:aspartate/glutamate racemase family protein [Roseomonas sp. MO-31]